VCPAVNKKKEAKSLKKSRYLFLLLALLVIAMLVAGCGGGEEGTAKEKPSRSGSWED
jgi:hypothetical protein